MKESDNAGALRIIGNFVIQAAVQGDTAALEGHVAVYEAVLKATGQSDTVDIRGRLAVHMAIARAHKEQCAVKGRG